MTTDPTRALSAAIRTARSYFGTRHIPNYTGFSGYDPCGESEPEPVR